MAVLVAGFGLVGAVAILVIVPAVSPAMGAQAADLVRGLLGPRPVAALESTSFAIQDKVSQFVSQHDGGRKTISLAPNSTPGSSGVEQRGSSKLANIAKPTDVVSAPPRIGWQSYGPNVNGSPVMARALVSLDPQRPYAGIALVRIDLAAVKLHMMPGFLEPSHSAAVVAAFPGLGTTPPADKALLVAAFNGGFKAVNGHYGMMVDGVTVLPPKAGLATLAIYKDGHVALGVWGKDILPSPDIVAFRQNCPPILEGGQIGTLVAVDNRVIWGETLSNTDITWRTGLGLTRDGRYLIYAVGNGTSVETLARALQQAGAYDAMQLDINRPFAHFVTYPAAGASGGGPKAIPLLNEMEGDPTLYLVPHSRDYLYLTAP
jgi:hypothetical protein